MIDYAELKAVHVTAAALSATLFVARGAHRFAKPDAVPGRALRTLPHAVDTVLLASALALAWHWGTDPLVGWLGAKLVALAAYIGLGLVALDRSRTLAASAWAFAAACATFAYIASVALTKRPAGFLAWL